MRLRVARKVMRNPHLLHRGATWWRGYFRMRRWWFRRTHMSITYRGRQI